MNKTIVKHLKRLAANTNIVDVLDPFMHVVFTNATMSAKNSNFPYTLLCLLNGTLPIYSIMSNDNEILLSAKKGKKARQYIMVRMYSKDINMGKRLFAWRNIKRQTFLEMLTQNKWKSKTIDADDIDTNASSKGKQAETYSGRFIIVGHSLDLQESMYRYSYLIVKSHMSRFLGDAETIPLIEVSFVIRRGSRGGMIIESMGVKIPLDAFFKTYMAYKALDPKDPSTVKLVVDRSSTRGKYTTTRFTFNVGYISDVPQEIINQMTPKAVSSILQGDNKK